MALIDNLVSWWELNETSGIRVDAHGVNDLSDVNTVLYATGKQGNGADFEKDNSESLQIADASQVGLDITGDMSISGWVKWESITNQQVNLICSKTDSATDFAYYFMNWDTEAPIGTRALALWLKRTDGTSKIFYKTYAFTTATWYHVTATYKASTGTVTFYVNGSSLGTHVDATYTAIKDVNAGGFAIGARYTDEGYITDAVIDELAIWSKELTSAENTELYNSGTGLAYGELAGDVLVSPAVLTATFSLPASTVTGDLQPNIISATFSIPTFTITAQRIVTASAGVLSARFSTPQEFISDGFWNDKYIQPETSWADKF